MKERVEAQTALKDTEAAFVKRIAEMESQWQGNLQIRNLYC